MAAKSGGRWITTLVLCAFAVFSLGPIAWLFLSSVKSRQELFSLPPQLLFTPDFSGYASVFGLGRSLNAAGSVGLVDALLNSLIVSVCGTVVAVLLGTLAGYAASRFRFRGRDDFMFFALSTRMIPPVAVLVFYHVMYSKLGLTDTLVGLVLVTAFINLGLATWIMKGYFDGVPIEVESTALINGYSRLYAFWHLVLPMVKGGIAATAGFCFIFSWNEFAFSSILSNTHAKTLPVRVSSAMGAAGIEWGQIFAGGAVLVVPVAIFFYLIRRHLLMGMTFGILGHRQS
jgi:multiple sugar transport system permease protein